MKKLLLVLLLFMPFFVFSQNQIKKDESKSKAVLFASRDGSLIKKELFFITDLDKTAEIKEVAFTVILYTDLFSKEEVACLQINTSIYNSLTRTLETAVGTLDADEVDKCYESLVYIRDNIISNTPVRSTDCSYTSRDFVRMGVSTNDKKEWIPFIRADRWKYEATVLLKKDMLDKIILNISLAKAKIKELVK